MNICGVESLKNGHYSGLYKLMQEREDEGKLWITTEKGTTEDEMVGWHHRLNGHEFE